MFFRSLNKVLLIFLGFSVISACSGYEKLLKSDDYVLKYKTAMKYYEEGEYVRSAALLDQVTSVYRGTTKADTVYYYQAQSYFMQRDYVLSGHYFSNLADNYPSSSFAEVSEFMSAFCHYKMSPKPSLDQTNTLKAINAFQLYLIKYPGSKRFSEARDYILEMEDKLVEKSYMSGKLYYNLGEYKAAIIALQNSLSDYPETGHREELMFLLLKSSFYLADNSVITKRKERFQNTIDEYYSFVSEFPDSKFRREADRLYQEAVQITGTETEILSEQ